MAPRPVATIALARRRGHRRGVVHYRDHLAIPMSRLMAAAGPASWRSSQRPSPRVAGHRPAARRSTSGALGTVAHHGGGTDQLGRPAPRLAGGGRSPAHLASPCPVGAPRTAADRCMPTRDRGGGRRSRGVDLVLIVLRPSMSSSTFAPSPATTSPRSAWVWLVVAALAWTLVRIRRSCLVGRGGHPGGRRRRRPALAHPWLAAAFLLAVSRGRRARSPNRSGPA